jgi:TfoX-like protein
MRVRRAFLREGEMARDKGLEELMGDGLASVPGLTEKAMFGGWAWLLHGNLMCAARAEDGMLLRVGKENEAWALEIAGVVPMISRGRRMQGWVRAAQEVYGSDRLRERLLRAAVEFTGTLPGK